MRGISIAARVGICLVVLATWTSGCRKSAKQNPDPSADSPRAPDGGPLGAAPTNEDPEVAAYVKSKGWSLMRDMRISDGKRLVYLTVENRDKPFEDTTVTDDDLKMIAKSKSVQALNIAKVKNLTDAGLKHFTDIPQLEAIILGGEEVTDAGMKTLAQCKTLDDVTLMTKKITDAGVKELAALPKLRSLMLMFLKLDGSCFAAFAGKTTLESLTLDYVDGLTDDGVKNLAKLPNLNALKIGSGFGEQKLTAAGIKAIVDARLPAKFEFDKKLLDDDLFEALVTKGWLYGPTPEGSREKRPAMPGEVKSIAVDGSKVTDKGLRAILNCTNVTSLFLGRTGVTDETLKKLAAFKKLDYLALDRTKVTAAGLEAVSGLPLKHLSLEGCELTEDAFRAFGKMTAMEELWLAETKMKPEWLKHITGLSSLRDLNLRNAAFDDAAAKLVVNIASLESITVNGTELGDAGFTELLKLPKLRSLYVDGTKVSKEVYQQAKKSRPKMTLYYYRYDQ